jgi:hypothetical protein
MHGVPPAKSFSWLTKDAPRFQLLSHLLSWSTCSVFILRFNDEGRKEGRKEGRRIGAPVTRLGGSPGAIDNSSLS